MVKSRENMKIKKENMYFSDFANEQSERAEIFAILARKMNEKFSKIDVKCNKGNI